MYFHVMLCHPNARIPTRGIDNSGKVSDPHAVGYDLYSPIEGIVDPLSRLVLPLGIKTEFAPGYEGYYAGRSGIAARNGITFMGGLIDPSYRGEWKVTLLNTSHEPFKISVGDRVVQVVFRKVEAPEVVVVDKLSESTRGEGGLGSSGK